MKHPGHTRLIPLAVPLAAILAMGPAACSRRAMEPGGPLAPGLAPASNAAVTEEYQGPVTCVGCGDAPRAHLRLYEDGTYELEDTGQEAGAPDGGGARRVERGRYTREQGTGSGDSVYRLEPEGSGEPRRYVRSEDGKSLRPIDEQGNEVSGPSGGELTRTGGEAPPSP